MAQWVECQTANQAAWIQISANINGFFLNVFWLLVVRNPRKTVGPKGKGQRPGVVTKRLGACLGFDSRDRSLTGEPGH